MSDEKVSEASLEAFKKLVPHNWKKPSGEPFEVHESVTRQAFVLGAAWRDQNHESRTVRISISKGAQELEDLREERAAMRLALAFYANEENWDHRTLEHDGHKFTTAAERDRGVMACCVLVKFSAKGGEGE